MVFELSRRFCAFVAALCACALSGCGDVSVKGNSGGTSDRSDATNTCTVAFHASELHDVKGADIRVFLDGTAATPVVHRNFARCISRVGDGEVGLAVDRYWLPGSDDPLGILYFKRNGDRGWNGPSAIADCLFTPGEDSGLSPEHFRFEILSAFDPSLAEVTPPPVIEVSAVSCTGTVTSTTTTTLSPSSCSTTTCLPDETCIGGLCTQTNKFEIRFRTAVPDDYGALQFNVFYPRGLGGFASAGTGVECRANPNQSIVAAYNHDVGSPPRDPVLRVGIYATAGFDGDDWLVRCLFESELGRPDVEDFKIDLVDASSSTLQPLAPEVLIDRVTAVASDSAD